MQEVGKCQTDALIAEILGTLDWLNWLEKNAERLLKPEKVKTPITFKILETLAQRLGPSSQTSGRINLISEKMVCPSCSDVVAQFRERYPNIQLNVFTVEK